jgi:hypothetical protein
LIPTVGRAVHVHSMPASENNGADVAAATITRVWSETAGKWCVNVRVHRDAPTDSWLTSVYLYDDVDQAANDPSRPRRLDGSPLPFCVWPPRV